MSQNNSNMTINKCVEIKFSEFHYDPKISYFITYSYKLLIAV